MTIDVDKVPAPLMPEGEDSATSGIGRVGCAVTRNEHARGPACLSRVDRALRFQEHELFVGAGETVQFSAEGIEVVARTRIFFRPGVGDIAVFAFGRVGAPARPAVDGEVHDIRPGIGDFIELHRRAVEFVGFRRRSHPLENAGTEELGVEDGVPAHRAAGGAILMGPARSPPVIIVGK